MAVCMETSNPVGRPRTHDREKIAEEMVEWAQKEDSINLCKFCCTRKPPISPRKITEWAKECNQFREAYDTAKACLGARREEWLASERLHVKAYDLNANTYDHFLKDEKRQAAEHAASLALDDKQKGTVLYVLNPSESAAYIAGQVPAETLPKEHS